MSDVVKTFQSWFYTLDKAKQEELLAFLYAGRQSLTESINLGPRPGYSKDSVNLGPRPASVQTANICPTWGHHRKRIIKYAKVCAGSDSHKRRILRTLLRIQGALMFAYR